MKAKLIKTDSNNFVLETNNGFLSGTLEPSSFEYKLSLKNCQAIERGYDLDELVESRYPIKNTGAMFMPNRHEVINIYRQEGFRDGFQKALEILGDKKFSEEDMIKFSEYCLNNNDCFSDLNDNLSKFQSLQQTEWDVEIVMDEEKEFIFDPAMGISQGHYLDKPKLDADGCLILKRK